MEQNLFNLNNQIYSNNNKILLEIVNDLQKLMKYSKDNIINQTLGNIINKMNYIINENKKNSELMKNEINKIYQKYDKLKGNNPMINNREYKELIFTNGDRYKGQVLNGVPDGKGICYCNDGVRYEGDWRNNKRDGKGIEYYPNGEW